MNRLSINRYLDHAVLKPELTQAEAVNAIKLGVDYKVRTVCVRPADIELAKSICQGSETEVSCVLNFPHGTALSVSKADEARRYIDLGVSEIDMVANYGFVRSGLWDGVKADIEAVSELTKKSNTVLKVIFETAALNPEQITAAVKIAIAANADFVKTSTGFGWDGATEEAVAIMLKASEGKIGVKASGGIRDRQRAELFIEMGCKRLGVGLSSTPIICGRENRKEEANDENY